MTFLFDAAPQRVYWELTRACDLACAHCRACASPTHDPGELTTREIFRVLDDLAAGSAAHVILTGGDPLKRPDFFDIVEYTVALGLPCLVSPSATPLLSTDVIKTLALKRIAAMSLSLDGSTAAAHDAVRKVAGTYDRTLGIARAIVDAGIPLQINTLVTDQTRADLPHIHRVVQEIGAARWSLFFLIQVGRGSGLRQITGEDADETMNWALDRAGDRRPMVTTTEAPHYRRLAIARSRNRGTREQKGPAVRGMGIRDGNGVMFISHTGEIQPSGFLPLSAGNARTANPLQIYRESPLFQRLRRTDGFSGRCGRCEYREVCGGSRARAFAATGDPFGSDPLCSYEPGTAGRRSWPLWDQRQTGAGSPALRTDARPSTG